MATEVKDDCLKTSKTLREKETDARIILKQSKNVQKFLKQQINMIHI